MECSKYIVIAECLNCGSKEMRIVLSQDDDTKKLYIYLECVECKMKDGKRVKEKFNV